MANKYVTFTYFWENDFTKIKSVQMGEAITTEFRGCYSNKSLLFQMIIYPNGATKGRHPTNTCACLVYKQGFFENVTLKYRLYLLHNKKLIESRKFNEHEYTRSGSGWLGPQFSFRIGSQNFLGNVSFDVEGNPPILLWQCEIKIKHKSFVCCLPPSTSWTSSNSDCRIGEPLFNFVLDNSLPNTFSDVILIANDGAKFHCHRSLLSVAAPFFFRKLFESGMSECNTKEVQLPFSSEVLTEVLRFVYKNEILPENVKPLTKEVLNAAEMFQLESLKKYCVHDLLENVEWRNAVQMLVLSDTFSLSELKEKSICIVVENYDKIKSENEWVELVNTNASLALQVVSHQAEKLNVITSVIVE